MGEGEGSAGRGRVVERRGESLQESWIGDWG